MPANYTLLEKITVGAAGASSVTFSNIPQTGYTDLVVKFTTRTTENPGASAIGLQINGASTTLTDITLRSDGATATSNIQTGTSGGFGRMTSRTGQANDTTSSTFSNHEVYFPNYTSANYKSYSLDAVTENNATAAYAELHAGLWSSTAAITSIGINVYGGGGSFVQYSTFYLYGVAKLGTTPAIVPYATGGDTIMTDGTYWYHAFLASGTFTPQKGLSADVLVIGGGGGGSNGGNYGGGGGAGKVYNASTQSLTVQSYTCTIGAGGAGNSNGSSSTVTGTSLSLSATNGNTGSGLTGGTSGDAYSGGTGSNSAPFAGGGGGGSTAVGANAVTGGGNGGAGNNTYSSWLSTTGLGVSGFLAGGGGGASGATPGSGGSGGGGAGGTGNGNAATANTGSGGGGAVNATGGTGGSGLVIVRYAV